ncbi:hypothetical protein E2C01_077493 [Portunus trituberculatus]|uniref:Uncharacterized protein n=1 Tax=Portunus trituberculatus TaxID=210409 RepID=A0A5B7ILI8_PORTR|nr:hypothetical protein [Portunus trituberculatus]
MEETSMIHCYVLMGKVLPLPMRTFGFRWNAESKLKRSQLICLNQEDETIKTVRRKITCSSPTYDLRYWQ